MHQWGFAWREGQLTRRRWFPYAAVAIAVVTLALLVGVGPFPIDMIGTGGPVSNTGPPSIALLAFAATQAALVLALQPAGSRLIAQAGVRRTVQRAHPLVMHVYLWHMIPVILVAVAVYTTLPVPQPGIGTWQWWALRPLWIGLLAVLLTPLVLLTSDQERRHLRAPPAPGPGLWSTVQVLLGATAACWSLTRLAVGGVAPAGHLAVPVLAAYAIGVAALAATRVAHSAHPVDSP